MLYIYTWIFYSTGRSTLSAILFHFMTNYTGMVIEIGPLGEGIQVAVLYGFAVIAVFANRGIFFGKNFFQRTMRHLGAEASK